MVLGIYGAGGLGREVLELARTIDRREKTWEDFIFIDDGEVAPEVNGARTFAYGEAVAAYQGNLEITLGIGEPSTREKLWAKIERDGIQAATLIHPGVPIPETTAIGKGVTIQVGCFISCNVTIEDYVYIQPHANIGHDDILKKGCVISGFCNLSGNVKVGEYSYLGISSCYKEGVSIGDHAIVGMGAVACRDVGDGLIALGNPARPMRKNEDMRVFR